MKQHYYYTRSAVRVWFCSGLLTLAAVHSVLGATPTAKDRVTFSISGSRLGSALRRIGDACGVGLTTNSLSQQRVSLYVRDLPLETVSRALEQLFSVEPNGRVVWIAAKARAAWRLEENRSRRDLAARLMNIDQERFAEHVRREVRWADEHGRRLLSAEPEGSRKSLLQQRVTLATLLQDMRPNDRDRMMAGEALISNIGDLPGRSSTEVRNWLRATSSLGRLTDDALDKYQLVLLCERNSYNPNGGITLTVTSPKGVMRFRASLFQVPRPPVIAENSEKAERGKRVVTVRFADPSSVPTKFVHRNMDEMLDAVAKQTGVNIIADGYLRHSEKIDAPYEFRSMALGRVLDKVTERWQCDWRFLDSTETVVIVRARYWWLEDDADVPDDVVTRFRKSLGSLDNRPPLDELAALSELRESQIRRLVFTGLCPGAAGLVSRGFEDGTGVVSCLRFYRRLSPSQRVRVTSAAGLPLASVDADLVKQHLVRTLVTWVGATHAEAQADLVFQIEPTQLGAPGVGKPGWKLSIRSTRPYSSSWHQSIGPVPTVGR